MNAALKVIIEQALMAWAKTASGLTGIRGYLARKILEYGGSVIIEFISGLINKYIRKTKQKKAVDELEKVDKDPKSTVDEKGKAYEDMFNSGR